MDAIVLRAAVPGEASQLTAIAHAAKASWGYTDDQLAVWRDDLTVTEALIAAGHVECAVASDRIIGFCAVIAEGDVAELEHLWVDPSWMHKGVGAALFERAAAIARAGGARELRIVSDPNAAGFYLRMGAEEIGVHPSNPPGRVLPVLSLSLGDGGARYEAQAGEGDEELPAS